MENNKNSRKFAIFDKDQMVRRFTVLAFSHCDLLSLPIRDLLKMKLEFPKVFSQLFKNIRSKLNHELRMKVEMIRLSEGVRLDNNMVKNKLMSTLKMKLLDTF